jgi:hypothetical protein
MNRVEDALHIEYFEKEAKFGISLPRFGLSFIFNELEGIFYSEEFAGFSLAACQQMTDPLGSFTSYLVLSRGNETKLLLPVGEICGKSGVGKWPFPRVVLVLRAQFTANIIMTMRIFGSVTSLRGFRDHLATVFGSGVLRGVHPSP